MRLPSASVGALICVAVCFAATGRAAPNVTNVSLRGLQIGGTTRIVVEGNDLLPDPVLIASFPIASQQVRPDAKANRVEFDVTVAEQASPGIFVLRLANAKGVSNRVAMGVDRLVQQPYAGQIASLPVALTGTLSGTQVLATRIQGKKGNKLVADVEVQRLGGNFKPVLRIKDAGGRQIAWSPARSTIGGDARVELSLPEDGDYTVELHDVLFRAASPGHFRLKLGDLNFAELVYPLGVQAGTKAQLAFAVSNLPPGTTTEFDATGVDRGGVAAVPLVGMNGFSGSQPQVTISKHAEIVELLASDGKVQELPAAPIAVSGRLAKRDEEDQYILPVQPGSRLRIEFYSQRVGARVDGVLSLRNAQGAQVATSDDRPGTSDPGLEFAVPADMQKLTIAVRDLVGRGGEDYVYRVEVTDANLPDFSIAADVDRLSIPAGATSVMRLQFNRMGYNGPAKLSVEGLPASVQLSGTEIPAGGTVGLLTLSAPAGEPSFSVGRILAHGGDDKNPLVRVATVPDTDFVKRMPWLRDDVGWAIAEPAPVRITWADAAESPMLLGEKFPLNVAIHRAEGAGRSVRLRLLTTQVMPRKKVKENNKENEVDDVERALRLENEPTLGADVQHAVVPVVVPADLSTQDWGFVIAADVLADDNKGVVATTTTTTLVKRPVMPFKLELAGSEPLEAKAGYGETGKITGKLQRAAGFARSVNVRVEGLPKEYRVPQTFVAADKEDFELTVRFPLGTQPAELKDAKLVARYHPNPLNADVFVRSNEVPLGVIKVVPGEPPPANDPLAIFEDDEKFIAMLSQGLGTATLESQEKYSGSAAVKVTPDQRFNENLPGFNIKIRENPGPGEYRYIRFAWKKKGGSAICLQINHDGSWGPNDKSRPGAKFRYHAGSGGECFGASVMLDDKLPTEFVVVTRDLYDDFGEFTFTGIALSPIDGEYAVFDHLYLGHDPVDFDKVKPAN